MILKLKYHYRNLMLSTSNISLIADIITVLNIEMPVFNNLQLLTISYVF